MPDIFTATARTILDEAVVDMSSVIQGASSEAVNWKPGGDDTNSIAVLAVHSMHSTRSWFSVAVGAPLPGRDRDSEFQATMPDAPSLLTFLTAMQDDCRRLLEQGAVEDWSVVRETHARPIPDPDAATGVPAAWALLHALEHLREHTGQMLLTRQLWNRRS
jgi:uncharacterized damage-inducible protein DinB